MLFSDAELRSRLIICSVEGGWTTGMGWREELVFIEQCCRKVTWVLRSKWSVKML